MSRHFWQLVGALVVVVSVLAASTTVNTSRPVTAQAPPTLEERLDAALVRIAELEANAVLKNTEAQQVIRGPLVFRDQSVYTVGDNPNGDTPAHIADCVAGQVGGSYVVGMVRDLQIADPCNMGGRFPFRVIATWDEHNSPMFELRRYGCEIATCGGGQIQWSMVNDQSNPIRHTFCRTILTGSETNHNFPSAFQCFVTNSNGQMRWALTLPSDGGIMLHPGGEPACQVAGLSNGEQGVQPWYDFQSERLMIKTRDCQNYVIWEKPTGPQAPAFAAPNMGPLPQPEMPPISVPADPDVGG